MFLVDDVLLAPGKAAFMLFQELARKAQEEWLNDDAIKQELQQLYEMLERGSVSDQEFEARECRLLERLEQIARIKFQDKWGAAAADPPAEDTPSVVDSTITVTPLEIPIPGLPAPAPAPPLPAPVLSAPPPPISVLPPPPPLYSAPAPPPPLIAAPVPVPSPVVVASPPAVAAEAPQAAPPAAPQTALSIGQVIDCAVRALSVLRLRVSSITSVVPEDQCWKVCMELVERRGVPDTSDVLGLYELRLDMAGNVLRYERTQMRRRCDFAR